MVGGRRHRVDRDGDDQNELCSRCARALRESASEEWKCPEFFALLIWAERRPVLAQAVMAPLNGELRLELRQIFGPFGEFGLPGGGCGPQHAAAHAGRGGDRRGRKQTCW